MPTQFIWFDLQTRDSGSARRFYEQLLDWQISDPSGEMPAMIGGSDDPWGSISSSAEARARWMPYVQVEDVDAATERAQELGATVLQDKTRGPAGWFITIADPTGAALALWQPFPAGSA